MTPLIPYLEGKVVWEPACGDGNLLKGLNAFGIECFGTDILTGQDFFSYTPDRPFDIIVTNPPFTGKVKNQWLKRTYSLGKPFALLLPLTTLESMQRQIMFAQYGIDIIVMPRRLHFNNVKNCNFLTLWFTWNLGLPQQITFFLNNLYDKPNPFIPHA